MKRVLPFSLALFSVIIGAFQVGAQSNGKRTPITAKTIAQVTQLGRWDMKRTLAATSQDNAWVGSVAFSPDGSLLASGNDGALLDSGNFDTTVALWDVASDQPEAILKGPTPPVNSVTFSPDGTLVASASDEPGGPPPDPEIWLWNVRTGQSTASLQPGGAASVIFNPNGLLLAYANGGIQLWDVRSSKRFASLQHNDTSISLGSVAFSPDGSLLAAGEWEGTVRLWDVKPAHSVATLQGHTSRVNSVTFRTDGSLLASGSDDGTVRLWGIPAGS